MAQDLMTHFSKKIILISKVWHYFSCNLLPPLQVFESFQPAMIGVFSENSEECPNCAGLAKEFQKAAENLVRKGVLFRIACGSEGAWYMRGK